MSNKISEAIKYIFIGNIGIKSVKMANETVYERSGGYFYINLKT